MADLSQTIHLLGDLLGQVIADQESPALFALEERIRQASKDRRAGDAQAGARLAEEVAALDVSQARVIASSFALYFDLVNLAEEQARIKALREQELAQMPRPVKDSIQEAVAALKADGVTQEQMAALLDQLCIELVLTAHPTESKRRTILSKLNRISLLLQNLDRPDLMPREIEADQRVLLAILTAYWLTERARTAKPAVTDEVRTGLYFIDNVLWEVLPQIYDELDDALSRHYPGLAGRGVWLRLASWIGGDRDGNPNVTARVTAETLRLHRGLAVEKHRAGLQELSRRLSLSAQQVPPPKALEAWFERRHPLPEHVAYLEKRYAREPYRLALALLADDLAEASRRDMVANLLAEHPQPAMTHPDEFTDLLDLICEAVPAALRVSVLREVQRQFQIFGVVAARLDLREESGRLNAAVAEILRALHLEAGFDQMDGLQRRRRLVQLLSEPAPALARHPGVTAETSETFAVFQLLARASQIYGRELFGPFIISMAHDAADVLAVLLLARWAGCAEGLQIVPLFETVPDLEAAPAILESLFHLEVYRQHLATCDNHQMVMIGYSDSNKDGGYLAASWALYQGQERVAEMCAENNVTLTIFHGRGGTVARGGGPAWRSIKAQPPGTVNGRFRLTEQGEIITAHYSNPAIARRHLEQVVNAVLLASHPNRQLDREPAAWRQALAQMAETALSAYRNLVYETPGFLDYWQSATPIDEIKRLQIGSRPAARRPGPEAVVKIRAIPWVFSWMQSRFNLPGWFGLGSGLNAGVPLSLQQEMYAGWPFFRAVLENAELSLLKADMEIAALYSALASEVEVAGQLFNRIRSEYELTRQKVLEISGHSHLLSQEPVLQRAVQLRNPYVDPLNYVQVELLRRLRALPDQESPQAGELREAIVITINGIAAGLQNTG